MTEFLTVSEIAEAQDLKTVDVEVPEWGGCVRFMELSGPERLTLTDAGERTDWEHICYTVAMSMVDGDGNKMYPDPDGSELAGKSSEVIGMLTKRVFALNGMSPDAVGELEGNSESGPSAAPSSS